MRSGGGRRGLWRIAGIPEKPPCAVLMNEVLHNNHAERIRLNGIDCPEKGQAYGRKAKQAASELVLGRQVTLQTHGLDKHGRTIADVLLPDGTNVNHELVKQGWCWWYRKYMQVIRCWKS